MNDIKISEAVVVRRSQPNETRWGHFQFPSLCRVPGGALMETVSDAEDATCGYGQPLRRYVSNNEGVTRQDAPLAAPGNGPHASCAEAFDGEYLIMSASATFDLAAAGLQLPLSTGKGVCLLRFPLLQGGRVPGSGAGLSYPAVRMALDSEQADLDSSGANQGCWYRLTANIPPGR